MTTAQIVKTHPHLPRTDMLSQSHREFQVRNTPPLSIFFVNCICTTTNLCSNTSIQNVTRHNNPQQVLRIKTLRYEIVRKAAKLPHNTQLKENTNSTITLSYVALPAI
jgi:hypothetical protein